MQDPAAVLACCLTKGPRAKACPLGWSQDNEHAFRCRLSYVSMLIDQRAPTVEQASVAYLSYLARAFGQTVVLIDRRHAEDNLPCRPV
jgi:hypothetical protein